MTLQRDSNPSLVTRDWSSVFHNWTQLSLTKSILFFAVSFAFASTPQLNERCKKKTFRIRLHHNHNHSHIMKGKRAFHCWFWELWRRDCDNDHVFFVESSLVHLYQRVTKKKWEAMSALPFWSRTFKEMSSKGTGIGPNQLFHHYRNKYTTKTGAASAFTHVFWFCTFANIYREYRFRHSTRFYSFYSFMLIGAFFQTNTRSPSITNLVLKVCLLSRFAVSAMIKNMDCYFHLEFVSIFLSWVCSVVCCFRSSFYQQQTTGKAENGK
jgi:hypothetical protein